MTKLYFILGMIVVFSVIYMFFDKHEFAGWIDITQAAEIFELNRDKK